MFKKFLKNRKAQGMTEYVLIIFLIAILAYAAVQLFGGKIKNAFTKAGNEVDNAVKSK